MVFLIMARPPKPAEIKRATGRTSGTDSGGRKLAELSVVQTLPMADQIPIEPSGLGESGKELWINAWSTAITWLSPDSDFRAIEHACRVADDLSMARAKYRATLEAVDGRVLVSLNKSYADALAALGFDPVSRSRLGVAEVKRVSALDQLIANRQKTN
jgi:phage terminase small subunit